MRKNLGRSRPDPGDPRTSTAVEIGQMRRRHLTGVLDIEKRAYPRPWSRGMYLSELAMRGTRAYVVATAGGRVVGYGGVMMNGKVGHITTLAVADVWRRRRIATRVLVQLTAEILRRAGDSATLEVREFNLPATAFYTGFGYRVVGRCKNYYRETGEDAMIMTVTGIDAQAHHARIQHVVAQPSGDTEIEDVPPA